MAAKYALITGGSRGIGWATAQALAPTHTVILGASTPARAEAAAAQLPGAIPFGCDLGELEGIAPQVQELCDRLGLEELDVLVHSAGLAATGPIATTPVAAYERIFRVNIFAVAELTRALLTPLRAARGSVIAINSGAGHHSGPGAAVYSGSKFALRAFTDALRAEEPRLRVCSIHPGRTDTDMQCQLQTQMGNTSYDGSLYVSPEAVAAAVRFALDTPDPGVVNELSIRP